MKFEIKKQERETTLSLIRRFTRRVRESGVLNRARRGRFYVRNKSQTARKRSALRRIEAKKEYERAEKFAQPK
ncbi:MAG: 30S ribosomal protein S21 [Parcubacteria group bacterium]|nr:30S ribosomal protein S21 [Parcubacteria group bacterium]